MRDRGAHVLARGGGRDLRALRAAARRERGAASGGRGPPAPRGGDAAPHADRHARQLPHAVRADVPAGTGPRGRRLRAGGLRRGGRVHGRLPLHPPPQRRRREAGPDGRVPPGEEPRGVPVVHRDLPGSRGDVAPALPGPPRRGGLGRRRAHLARAAGGAGGDDSADPRRGGRAGALCREARGGHVHRRRADLHGENPQDPQGPGGRTGGGAGASTSRGGWRRRAAFTRSSRPSRASMRGVCGRAGA